MIKRRNNEIKLFFICEILLLMFCFPFFNAGTLKAGAETTGNNQTVENVIEQSVFVTFKKGDNASRGKYMTACFFVPNTVFEKSYTYGIIIFPKDYGIAYGLTSDYLKQSEEKGKAIINISFKEEEGIPEPNGYGFNGGVMNIYEANLSRIFAFIFYVQDTSGNTAYTIPQFTDYNSLDASELTVEELTQLTNKIVIMDSSLHKIMTKITELVDNVWVYVVIAFGSVVLLWGTYIGIRVIIAKKNEEKINARGMIKWLVIGIVVMFIIAVGSPLLINGLSHWITW